MDITIKDEYIKLDQVVKLSGVSGSGGIAKMMIQDGLVSVNGEIELRRGRKLYKGNVVVICLEEPITVNLF